MIGPTELCPQGIGLVFFDLDGTVMPGGAFVTPRTLDTISHVRERGLKACVSTGRAIDMLPESLCQPCYVDYLLCANGSQVYGVSGELLFERPMAREQALVAMDVLAPLAPAWYAFIGGRGYYEYRTLSYMTAWRSVPPAAGGGGEARRSVARRFARKLVSAALGGLRRARGAYRNMRDESKVRRVRTLVRRASGGVAKLGCTFASSDTCEQAVEALGKLGGFEVARMGSAELEITAGGVNKGTGARWLMDHLGVDPACAVAFGDSWNDVPLAGACGTFVAVANADEQVRAIADDVCESVHDDGVARWLERAIAEGDVS